MRYRAEIDGLRAVAVLVVILFHAGLMGPLQGGFVGVDVFFVLSGFLITGIIRSEQATGKFSLTHFYERRARRILPALVVVCAATVPLAIVVLLPFELEPYFKSLGSVALFISNVFFWDQSSYFEAAASTQILLHTWSLAVEEQFYLLFPLVLMGLVKARRAVLLSVLIALFFGSFALSVWGSEHKPQVNFFFTPSRFWELLAGALCAIMIERLPPKPNDMLAGIGLGMIAAAVAMFGPGTAFPGWATLLPVGGTAMVLLFAGPGGRVCSCLSWRPLVGLGLISYSAYLWHLPVLVLSDLSMETPLGYLGRLCLVFAILVLSWASWVWVEQPFRRKQNPLMPRRAQVFTASGVALSAMLGLGVAGMHWDGGLSHYSAQTQTLLRDYGDPRQTMRVFDLGRCFADMDQGGEDVVAAGCLKPKSPDDIVLWGDSYAAHLSYGLKAMSGRDIIQFTAASCRPFADPASSARCTGMRDTFWRATNIPPRTLIWASNWAGTAESAGEDVLLEIVGAELDALRSAGFQVILVGQSPEFPTHSWLRKLTGADIPPQELSSLALNFADLNVLLADLAEASGARFFDPSAVLCSAQDGMIPCLAIAKGQPLFADAGHFSAFGSMVIANEMARHGILDK